MQQNQKYFALADARRQARAALPRRQQPRDGATRRRSSQGNERVLRARLADAQLLLRPGPQDAARRARAEARERRLPQQARQRSSSAWRGSRARRRDRAARSAPTAALADARRAARQGGPRHRHGRRVPGAAGHHGPLLRAARRRAGGGRRRDRAALLAALRRRRAAARARSRRPSRSPTSSTRSPACSASASCPPATRTRSACAAHALGVLRILIEQRLAGAAARARRPRVRRVRRRCRPCKPAPRGRSRSSSSSGCAATCASTATRRNEVEAVLCQRPARIDLVPARLDAVRAFGAAARSRRARRGEQADRQHPAQVRRARRRPPSTARGSTDGAEHDLYLAFQKLEPGRRRALRRGRLRRRAAWRWPRAEAGRRPLLRRRAGRWPTTRPCARTGWRCCAASAQTMNRVADISKLAA